MKDAIREETDLPLRYEPADLLDIEPLFRLNQEMVYRYEEIFRIDYPKALDWIRKKITDHITEYVRVKWEGTLVGYYYFHTGQGQMELDDLYILPPYRNRGIGTAVMKKCISETELPIALYVFSTNERAVAFYQRLGFRIVSVHQTRYRMQRD